MDTRQKKFKYGRASRVLTALLSLFFSVVFIFNLFDVITIANYFGLDCITADNVSVFDAENFYNQTVEELDALLYTLNADDNQSAYKKQYAEIEEQIRAFYEEVSGVNEVFESDKESFAAEHDMYYSYYWNSCDEEVFYEEVYDDNLLYEAIQQQGREKDFWGTVFRSYYNAYYTDIDASYSFIASVDLGYDGVCYCIPCYLYEDDYYAEDRTLGNKMYLTADFDIDAYIKSCAPEIEKSLSEVFSSAKLKSCEQELASLENMQYYVETSDGNCLTNAKSKDAVLALISAGGATGYYVRTQQGAEDVLQLDNTTRYHLEESWEYSYSSEVSAEFARQITDYLGDMQMTLYLVFPDMLFSGNDSFSTVYEEYTAVEADLNLGGLFSCLPLAVFSLIAVVALFVCSLRLAGHRGNDVVTLPVDKLPWDIHFLFSGGCIAGLVVLLILLWYSGYNSYGSYSSADRYLNAFVSSVWFEISIAAAAMAVSLFFTEVFTCLARKHKARCGIYAYLTLPLIVRGLIKLLKLCKKSGKKTGRALYQLVFSFKYVSKGSWLLLGLGLIATDLFMVLGWVLADPVPALGVLFMVMSIGLFVILVWLVYRFLSQFDSIVHSFDTGCELGENTDRLPRSLRILASSYDENNRRLRQAVAEAVRSEQMKSELVTNVSHDLKTPLTSIINYSDLLQQLDIEDETERKYVGVINEKSNRLKKLIEDLIEVSKVTTGNVQLNKTALNLNELTAQAIAEEAADFDKYSLTLVFDEAQKDLAVWADGAKVYRIYQNLISNAKKYSAPGSRVYARVYSDEAFGCFEIKNISKTPLNISPEKLLERFVRADKARNEEGNGLGLSIAQELCSLNGGKLELVIDGDLFKATVRLPLYTPQAQEEQN